MMHITVVSDTEVSEEEALKIPPPFIAAVSTNEEGHPIRMNFTVLKGFRLTEISKWSK